MNLIKTLNIEIWDRSFSLNVEYDCYAGEEITPKQIEAVERLSKNLHWISDAKKDVVKYCKPKVDKDSENQKKDNIFSYVKPEALFVKRDDKKSRIALMCKYRYDPEHGLAVVFDANGNVTVGTQDIIL